uniref:Gustatory receptor n=1 Tax=Tribolium castaneum TaxID=7070 RepID=B8PUN7_TRICA|nr:gustatory receptor [Tribolium castaneum]
MSKTINSDIYFSFDSIYKITKCVGLLIVSFDRKKRNFYVTRVDILINRVVILFVTVLQTGVLVYQVFFLNSQLFTVSLIAALENSVSFVISYVNFYLYRTTNINIFKLIQTFDREVKYKTGPNSKFYKFKLFCALVLIFYVSTDIVCFTCGYATISTLPYDIISYLTHLVNLAVKLIFVFLVTELENRFIFIASMKPCEVSKHIITLLHVCSLLNNVHNFPLLLNATKICITLTISLSFSFYHQFEHLDLWSLFLTSVWLILGICEMAALLFISQNFYKQVSVYRSKKIIFSHYVGT